MIRAFADINGVRIFYRDTGTDLPTILCLHGRWGRGETWSDFINRYQDKYRIIAPDQRGHGLSDKPIARYASEDLAADMHELIRILDCAPVIVVGHSMGGRIGAYLTALYPALVRALAILDCDAAGPETLSNFPPERIVAADTMTADWPTPYLTYDDALNDLKKRFPYPSNVRYFLDSLVETPDGYDFLFSRFAMTALSVYQQSWYHLLPQLKCPVLLARAGESWCLSRDEAARMRALIPDCTYFEISPSDHMVYADNPAAFYPQFDQFLRKI